MDTKAIGMHGGGGVKKFSELLFALQQIKK